MRKTSIDELPQFFNVLLGYMSVIGPRPHMLAHTEQYRQIIDKYMVRQFLKPGISGWAQVNGFRGETKEQGLMEKRVEHDIWYMENWSVMLDIKIVFYTIINVFKGEENAY
jgi:putative colanic acid biosynthesis UDP-glucose lipid carrier transferase